MKDVKCWCCEYFYYIDPQIIKEGDFIGLCEKKLCKVFGGSKVCENFIIQQGLHINPRLNKT